MITVQEFAKRIQADIEADIQAGIVPSGITDFADLHDYVDANCYGGSEDMLDELVTVHGNEHDALMAICSLFNDAIPIVEAWMQERQAGNSEPQA